MTTTTQAAELAGVTTATVRHWARYGAIKATKQAGRWIIDTASLTRRINLGIRRPAKKEQPMPATACEHTADPEIPCRGCQKELKPVMFDAYVAALTDGLDLPELVGTPKQVAWAEDLRARQLAGNKPMVMQSNAMGRILGVTWEAGWWELDPTDPEEFGVEYPREERKFRSEDDYYQDLAGARAHITGVLAEHTDATWWIETYGR